MSSKVKCTCGWSWNKSDSSKKDMYVCHECGRDNSNNIPKAQEGIQTLSSRQKKGNELAITETENAKKDKHELLTTGQIKNPRSIAYKSKVKKQPELNQDNRSDVVKKIDEEKGKNREFKKTIKPIIQAADVTTDLMQLGNFVPHPVGQAIGEIGNIVGAGIDTYQAADDFSEGNYGSGTLNALSAIAPMFIENAGYTRNMYNTNPGSVADKIASLGNRSGNYVPLTLLPRAIAPSTIAGVNYNRALLGTLAAETVYDTFAGSSDSNDTPSIQYYNTNPKRGDVEKPGQSSNVQYVPVSNSAELKQWKKQKLTPLDLPKPAGLVSFPPELPKAGVSNIKQKNGGWLDNYNDSQASAPEGMVGDGFSNVGRNYSPAWGGQFQNGGYLPLTKEIAKGRYEGDLKNMVYKKRPDGKYDITYQAPPEVFRQPVQAIKNNLKLAGLTQSDLDIDANAEMHPETRRAKYYDVEDFTHGSTNYNGRQTNYRTSDLSSLEEQSPNNTRKIVPHYQMGGSVYPVNYVPQAQEGKELTFLQPTSEKLPQGYRIPYSDPSSERAMSIGGENGEPAYLIPSFKYGKPLYNAMEEFRNTGEHLGGPFKTWQDADKWENETRHPAVEKGENIMFPQEQFQMGGSLPGATGHMYARYEEGGKVPGDVGFSYPRTGEIPSNGPGAKKTMASAQNGKEMQYYQNGLDFQPKSISRDGSVIKDDRGQWDHPGEITEIGSNDITMEGVPYDVLGISDTGDTKLMKPGKNYKFKGKKVTEYPMAKNGLRQEQKGLQNLDNLTNFTNYNKPQPGGWLNKYN